ncbi:hypothetical protein TNCT_368971, partial [Trichonephila clavata]
MIARPALAAPQPVSIPPQKIQLQSHCADSIT